MNKKRILAVAVILLVTVSIGLFASSKLNNKSSNSAANTVCDLGVTCVDLYDNGASLDEVSVKVGESIQFNAKGSSVYHLANNSDQGSLSHDHGSAEKEHISSGDFSGDEAWLVKFSEPGTFNFSDENNPEIKILVVVYNPEGGAKLE